MWGRRMAKKTVRAEVWEKLSVSHDLSSDLAEIYPAKFFVSFAKRFDRSPAPFDLIQPVEAVARAYLRGKWEKAAERSNLLKYSGAHMIQAGVAARQVARELRQITKSDLAHSLVADRLSEATGAARPFAATVQERAERHHGPEKALQHIEELCAALSEAIDGIIPLPPEDEDAPKMTVSSFDFVEEFNAARQKTLAKNHPMEMAARAFRPTWEAYSTLKYQRGRYKFERGDYDSPPANALFEIVTRLDSSIPLSLAGTAIENVRTQPKEE